MDSARCVNCGAELRDGGDALFAAIAPDDPPRATTVAPVVAPVVEVAGDPNGFAAVIARVRPDEAERAAVPICVSGALLRVDEVARGSVTGQMLGCPAVVLLTDRRVIVVNGRRWQPIVDTFDLGPELIVRGRHDRHVALLTFSEGSRLSTVDGITDVDLAVELTELMRTA